MDSNLKTETLRSQYNVGFLLGQGSFGTVKLAWHLKTKALVAIKTVQISEKNIRWIQTERAILETLQHPYIIRLFQVLETASNIHFILEYVPGGNLFEIVRDQGQLSEEEAKKTFGQIVSGIKFCHQRDIVHGDIKPDNIVRDAKGNIKIIDFGLARRCRPGRLMKVPRGARIYFAPELILREPYEGKKADVWSLGVLLFFITAGFFPFRGETIKEISKNILTGTYAVPRLLSGQLENLIHQVLTVPPEMRPSIEEIENHPWVRKCEITISTKIDPDFKIIDMLCDMGYNAIQILNSLHKKKYDAPMGAYLTLKAHVDLGHKHGSPSSAKAVDPCPTPSASPTHTLPLKRRASEPNFGLLHIRPSGEQGPVPLKPSGHKLARSVSLPPIALHYPCKQSRASSSVPHSRAVAGPCVCNNVLEIETLPTTSQDSEIEITSPCQKIGRLKKFRRWIRNRFSNICCFPCARRKK